MERRSQPLFNAQIHQRACEWFVEFRNGEPDEAARRAFHAWLQESPQHMGAYLQITALWNEGAAVDRKEKWTFDTLIAQAAADPGNIVSLNEPSFSRSLEKERMLSSPRNSPLRVRGEGLGVKVLLAASLLLAVVGISAWFVAQRNTYFTATGEQRSIALPDGSTVNLNSRSRISVRYSEQERAVELQEGQALFEVAKNPNRPFIVTSGKTRVRAVGTRFDVYRKVNGTVVTVIEGRVAALPPSPRERRGAGDEGPHEVFLSAGEQLRIASNTVPRPIPADIARATAWTQRQLVFDSTPLAEVAEEFNRYNTRQLVIRNPALNTFQIDGVFASTDPASLIRFLHERPDIQVTETRTDIVITRK